MPEPRQTPLDQQMFSMRDFAERNGISLRQAWKELAAHRLEAVTVGEGRGRTLITKAGERKWQCKVRKRKRHRKLPKKAVRKDAAAAVTPHRRRDPHVAARAGSERFAD